MKPLIHPLTVCAMLMFGGAAQANDFPTLDRVLYVQECLQDHPGHAYEMISKCSCAQEALAKEVTHDDYMSMHTAKLALRIGGERGSYIRANKSQRDQIKRFDALQAKVKKGCFINAEGR